MKAIIADFLHRNTVLQEQSCNRLASQLTILLSKEPESKKQVMKQIYEDICENIADHVTRLKELESDDGGCNPDRQEDLIADFKNKIKVLKEIRDLLESIL